MENSKYSNISVNLNVGLDFTQRYYKPFFSNVAHEMPGLLTGKRHINLISLLEKRFDKDIIERKFGELEDLLAELNKKLKVDIEREPISPRMVMIGRIGDIDNKDDVAYLRQSSIITGTAALSHPTNRNTKL